MFNADVIWKDSFIKLSPEKEWIELETRQFNSVIELVRIAYMKALSMPLQVRDIYLSGQGHMYGKLFNLIPVLNAKGKEISQSSLTLYLPRYCLFPAIVYKTISNGNQ